MNTKVGQFLKLGFITLTAVVGSITVGLIMHGTEVFNYKDIYFAYVAFGLTGGFIFAFYHLQGLSNTITAAVSTSAVQFIIASASMPVLYSAFWSFGVNLPVVWLAFLFERKLSAFHWGRFIVIGLVYGTMFVLLTMIVGVLRNVSAIPPMVFRDNFIDGLMIGIGVGLGVQAGEAFIDSLKKTRVE